MTTILGVLLPLAMFFMIAYGIITGLTSSPVAGGILCGFGLLMLTAFHCTEMILREIRKECSRGSARPGRGA
jgi:VIT1/CCC1 family predicted Fe2+/Mn2+ transporter